MTPPATTLRPGNQLASAVCGTRVVVIRAPADTCPVLACGGSPMVPAAPAQPSPAGGPTGPTGPTGSGTLIGKRYVDAEGALEVLCTASGAGELTCDGVRMTVKAAKPLPASD